MNTVPSAFNPCVALQDKVQKEGTFAITITLQSSFKELFCKPKQLDEVKTFSKMSKHVQSPRDCRVTRNVT